LARRRALRRTNYTVGYSVTEMTFDNVVEDCVQRLTKLVEVDHVETFIVAGENPQGWLYGGRLDVHLFPGNIDGLIHTPKHRF